MKSVQFIKCTGCTRRGWAGRGSESVFYKLKLAFIPWLTFLRDLEPTKKFFEVVVVDGLEIKIKSRPKLNN